MKRILFISFLSILGITMSTGQTNRNLSFKNLPGIVSKIEVISAKQNNKVYRPGRANLDANGIKGMNSSANLMKVSKTTNVVPGALYNRPVGTYIPSLIGNEDPTYLGYNYGTQGIFGSAFSVPFLFRNLSTGATSYSWDWGSSKNYSNDQNLIIKTIYTDGTSDNFLYNGDYYAPKLNAINGTDTAKYLPALNGTNLPSISASSGTQYISNADYYGNASLATTAGYHVWWIGAANSTSLDGTGSGNFWGTCLRPADGPNGTKVNSIVTVFEKPMSTMVIKDVCLFGASDKAIPVPATKYLTLTLYKINDAGQITNEVLASSKILGAEVIVDTYNNCYFPFTFTQVDPVTGRETPMTLIVKDAFAVVLSGLEQNGCDFGLLSDQDNKIEGTSFFTKVDASTGVSDGNYYNADVKMNTYMMLNSYFNYLYPDPTTQTLSAPVAGGDAVDAQNISGSVVYSYFNLSNANNSGDSIWIDPVTLPSWLTISHDNSLYAQYGVLVFNCTATALPVGVAGRKADIVIQSFGAETTIHITQGIVSGIASIKATKSKVFNSGSTFELTYPADFNKVSLINLSGQLIGSYNLPDVGKFSIPTGNISRGLYLLKFDGQGTETIKVNR